MHSNSKIYLKKRNIFEILSDKFKSHIANYSIHKKIQTSFGLIIGSLIIFMVIVILLIFFISSRTTSLYNGPYKTTDIISNMRVSVQKLDKNIYKALNETNLANKKVYLSNVSKEVESLSTNFELLKDYIDADSEPMKQLSESLDETIKSQEKISNLIKDNADIILSTLDIEISVKLWITQLI